MPCAAAVNTPQGGHITRSPACASWQVPGLTGATSVTRLHAWPGGDPHVLYRGDDGKVRNDNYNPSPGTWFDQIPPGSIRAQSSPRTPP
jgi:hypothetical protein